MQWLLWLKHWKPIQWNAMVAMAEALETYPLECSGYYEPMTEALETYPVEGNGCYD